MPPRAEKGEERRGHDAVAGGGGAGVDAMPADRGVAQIMVYATGQLMMKSKLTHLDDSGRARMVDVGSKPVTSREAVAEGFIIMSPDTLRAIAEERVPKGEVLGTARVAGIMAAKRCGELIPMCHPLPVESVEVGFDVPELEPDGDEKVRLHVKATARITAKNGGGKEALT